MYVHKNSYDFAFSHIPKTGGTSIRKLLLSTKLPIKQVGNMHATLSMNKKQLKKYKHIYTNVRNPYARVVSLYVWDTRKAKEMSFKDFFYNHWYPNPKKSTFLLPMHEHILVDGKIPENLTIVKLEEVDKFWPAIMKFHFKKKILVVPRENATIHGDPMEYFDKEMIEKVKEKEGWVLDFYGS